ncbi:MAG: HigA family addiction module antidote protein [Rubrobacteraceae bacterium]|nr:HigA family addiction module antidote protein [Rubrobacteraceae bacterium]
MGDWSEEIEREPRVYPPVHPGEILREEWLVPLKMNANQLAKALGVPRQGVYEIINGKRGISAEMALRLARWSHMRPEFWLGLQEDYDLETAKIDRGEELPGLDSNQD